jgi:CMP-N-acetylneuraminic acid synthetase
LRNSKILDESFSALEKSNMDCLISLVKDKQTPFKSFLIKDGLVQSLFKESDTNKNRQDLQPTYRANGAIYTFLISEFLRNKGFPSNASIPFIMSEEASLDIDSYEDLDTLKSRL